MKPRVLLLVHMEESFRRHFQELIPRLVKSIKRGSFDEVIHFTSHINDDAPVPELDGLIDKDVDWAWGYEPEAFEDRDDELSFVINSSGHDYTWVPPELRHWTERLRHSKVSLAGGCDGECLADMESVLNHLRIRYRRKEQFVYSYTEPEIQNENRHCFF